MKNKYSILAIVFIIIIELYLGFIYYPKYKNGGNEATISWDVSGYYMYLPATFIYKDIKQCSFQDSVLKNYTPIPNFDHAAYKLESGNYVMKYSSGQAFVFSPAFFIAHLYAKNSKLYPADGFSYPYQLAISIWTFLISIFGIIVLRKVLLNYFEDKAIALTLFSIAICSNYIEYAAISGGLTHNTLFTLYALLLFFTIRFYKKTTFLNATCIGFLCGLATLIRPTEMLSLIIPIFWGITSVVNLKERIQLFIKQYQKIFLALLVFILVGSIQLIYWKYVSGHFLVYSYQNQGFDWLHPHIIDCLISAKAGWILYSPIFVFALIGMFSLYKNQREVFLGVLLFVIPFTYLCFAWSEWWYGWSLGQRAMIQSYPIWAFAFAAFYQQLLIKNKIIISLFFTLFLSLIIYNSWLIHHGHKGGLMRGPEMTKEYFWEIFMKNQIDKKKLTLLDNKDYYRGNISKLDTIYLNDFNDDTSSVAVLEDSISKNKKLVLEGNFSHSSIYRINMNDKNKSKWYRLTADITCVEKEWNTWEMPQLVVKFKKNDQTIKQNMIRINRLLEIGETKNIELYAKPHRTDYDYIEINFSLMNSPKKIIIDNLVLEKIIE